MRLSRVQLEMDRKGLGRGRKSIVKAPAGAFQSQSMLRAGLTHFRPALKKSRVAFRTMSTKEKLSKPITFVTGNQNKLREVSAIIGDSIALTNAAIDRTFTYCTQFGGLRAHRSEESATIWNHANSSPSMLSLTPICLFPVPELQGPPHEVAIEKCKLAAAQVRCHRPILFSVR